MGIRAPLLLLPLLFACSVPSPNGGRPGGGMTCTDSSGKTVDVSTLFGKWKKTSGYSPERSAEEIALNFEIIMFEPGDKACMANIVNGAAASTVFRADYTNDVKNKQLTLNYTAGSGSGNADKASYSLSGDCTNLSLRINYDSGNLRDETFALYSKTIAGGTCSPQ